jgi:transcriptional antiterminator RfaH
MISFMKWLVLYTKPNFEIKVAQGINKLGIKAYCPVYKQLKQYSDRKKKVEKPLLLSYVLVYISEKDRPLVFKVPGVLRYVFWLGKPAEVRNEEIELMQNNLSGIYDSVTLSKLEKGKIYTIPSGPFKGQTGKVLNIIHNTLKLELPSLGLFVTLSTAKV